MKSFLLWKHVQKGKPPPCLSPQQSQVSCLEQTPPSRHLPKFETRGLSVSSPSHPPLGTMLCIFCLLNSPAIDPFPFHPTHHPAIPFSCDFSDIQVRSTHSPAENLVKLSFALLFNLFIHFWPWGVFTATQAFLPVAESEGCSPVAGCRLPTSVASPAGARALSRAGGLRSLGDRGSVVAAPVSRAQAQ